MWNDCAKICRKNKIEGRNWSIKRKKGELKKAFIKFLDRNSGKQRHNNFCNNNDNPELIAEIEGVNTSEKRKPNWENFRV